MTYQSTKDEWLSEMERLTEQHPEADMDELKALAMTNVLKTTKPNEQDKQDRFLQRG